MTLDTDISFLLYNKTELLLYNLHEGWAMWPENKAIF